MKIKQRTLFALALVMSVVVLSCGLGQSIAPVTPAPTSTSTLTPLPTNTPTLTPDPMISIFELANDFWSEGKTEDAIALYKTILEQSENAALRNDVFARLIDFASTEKIQVDEQYESSWGDELKNICEMYGQIYSDYELILAAKDRPSFEENPFYAEAAATKILQTDCALTTYPPEISYSEAITTLLDAMVVYPISPEISDVFVPAIVGILRNEATDEYAQNPTQVVNNGQLIKEKIGDYLMTNGQKVSNMVDIVLLEISLCAEPFTTSMPIATSGTKKILSCLAMSAELEDADLLAQEPGEVWFVLNYERVDTADIACRGRNLDTGKSFSYTYDGPWREIFTLRDVNTGESVSKKTFASTAPRCVFTSCSLNTATNTAFCYGGEAESTFDAADLIEWLNGQIK